MIVDTITSICSFCSWILLQINPWYHDFSVVSVLTEAQNNSNTVQYTTVLIQVESNKLPRMTNDCFLHFLLLFYHKVQIKTSTAFSHFHGLLWGGFEAAAVIWDRMKQVFRMLDDLSSAGRRVYWMQYRARGFVTERHIHSQAVREMNAHTVQHGSLGRGGVFTFLSFVSFISQAWVDTTQSTSMSQRYLQIWFMWRGRHVGKDFKSLDISWEINSLHQ